MADAHSDWQLNDHVHQATGMIAEQLNCNVSQALARLKIRAASTGPTVDMMALDVLDRVVRFDGRRINCRSASHDSRADKPANQAKSLPAVFVLAARSAAVVRSWSATLFDHAELADCPFDGHALSFRSTA